MYALHNSLKEAKTRNELNITLFFFAGSGINRKCTHIIHLAYNIRLNRLKPVNVSYFLSIFIAPK